MGHPVQNSRNLIPFVCFFGDPLPQPGTPSPHPLRTSYKYGPQTDSNVAIKRTLEREAKRAQWLVIWTDCDRDFRDVMKPGPQESDFQLFQECDMLLESAPNGNIVFLN